MAVRPIVAGAVNVAPDAGLVKVADGGAFAPCTVTLTVADDALAPALSYATARRP